MGVKKRAREFAEQGFRFTDHATRPYSRIDALRSEVANLEVKLVAARARLAQAEAAEARPDPDERERRIRALIAKV
ncbi:adenylyltransferase and sulfurtransferase, uba4 [Deinococcus grandis]|uniref:Adenylyltransferase and sulfurtransferase, uba4 n=1 Tax=Deinococcus grandis TaxID=57498 RepID=A0A117DRZ8_9DEIO|nr:adenylyltransferase and sulfurtransferase, uba4 [Deinococcus grandis]